MDRARLREVVGRRAVSEDLFGLMGPAATCLSRILCGLIAVAVLVIPAGVVGQDEEPKSRISAVFTPVNLGRFTFSGDEGLAYDPNLKLCTGLNAGYQRILRRHFVLGLAFRYLHTMTEYGGAYAEQGMNLADEGMRGYADILRPSLEVGGLWSAVDEDLEFTATLSLGPSFVWFEDIRMSGLHGVANGGAAFWVTKWLGLYVGIALAVDGLWARDAAGWAKDELSDARAYTLFLNVDLGARVRF